MAGARAGAAEHGPEGAAPYGSAESDYRPERWGGFREDYRFTGKEEDVEVGLKYFGKRYLSAGLGRWVSADPLTVHRGGADLNGYAYVHGSVLKNVDPVGLAVGSPAARGSYENPIQVNEAPDGVAPGERFAALPAGQESQTLSAKEFRERTSGVVVFIYNPEHGMDRDSANALAVMIDSLHGGRPRTDEGFNFNSVLREIHGSDPNATGPGATTGTCSENCITNNLATLAFNVAVIVNDVSDVAGGFGVAKALGKKGIKVGINLLRNLRRAGREAIEEGAEGVAKRAAAKAEAQVTEGTYEFTGQSGKPYVGQSNNIPRARPVGQAA